MFFFLPRLPAARLRILSNRSFVKEPRQTRVRYGPDSARTNGTHGYVCAVAANVEGKLKHLKMNGKHTGRADTDRSLSLARANERTNERPRIVGRSTFRSRKLRLQQQAAAVNTTVPCIRRSSKQPSTPAESTTTWKRSPSFHAYKHEASCERRARNNVRA